MSRRRPPDLQSTTCLEVNRLKPVSRDGKQRGTKMGTILEQKYLSLSERLRQRASRGLLTLLALVLLAPVALPQTPAGKAPLPVTPPSAAARPAAAAVDDSAKLITEFEVNGLKVLLKRREGSQTVVAGLFFRGGARNITAENAGVEGL